MTYEFGVVGLGVMGSNLARNVARKGFGVAGYDVDLARGNQFVEHFGREGRLARAATPEELVKMLEPPRRILVLVPAGPPVDSVIAHLRPHLNRDDILIDGGNSFFKDTDRRTDELAAAGLRFVGMGVSGGEEGALLGPSMMPGGSREAWDALAPILKAIAAKADDGTPCVAYMGQRGAGHYVKMVHNGIEYGDMQLIAEVYDLLHRAAGLSAGEIASVFSEWNRSELRSYLIEITAAVLWQTDPATGQPLVDVVLDEAQQKGTGKWMSQNAFDLGAPVPTVTAAVEARILSSLKQERMAASQILRGPSAHAGASGAGHLVEAARQALYACKVASYAQGFALMKLASNDYGYAIDPVSVARIWRAGCIIRADLLSDIAAAFERNRDLPNLMLDKVFSDSLESRQEGWRHVVTTAVVNGIPLPAMATSLAYYDGYRSARLPANLTQAQRDFFGAHTYRRTDKDGVFHTDWSGVQG